MDVTGVLKITPPLKGPKPETSGGLGREEGALWDSVESFHEIICCLIRVSQNGPRVSLTIFSTSFIL